MHLEKLELQGFKSFVRKTSLTFPQPRSGERRGVAAIVGPNGSGKSNLADALRWVMGEQSLKSLRGKKSEDVIFSGTDKLARVGMAEVSISFNNEDRQAPIDYSQVTITRRLYRNGESDYLINGKKVRLTDVVLLLAQASCGQKTYSIIGQGMVDAFLSASPAERKEYFDEAAGTRHLQIKKDQSLHKLAQAEENLRQGEALMQEITPRLRSLTRQVKRLERREEIAAKLEQMQKDYYGSMRYQVLLQLTGQERALREISNERQKEETALNTLEEKFSDLETAAPVDERFTTLQQEQKKLWEARSALRDRIATMRTALASEELKGKQAPELSRAALLPLYHEIESAVKELKTFAATATVTDLADVQTRIDQLSHHVLSLRTLVVLDDHASKSDQQQHLEAQLTLLSEEEQSLQQRLKESEARLQTFHTEEQAKNKKIFDLEREVRVARERVAAVVSKENDHKVAMAKLSAEKENILTMIREELHDQVIPENTVRYSEPEKERMKREIEQLKGQLAHIGSIDEETQHEYEETKNRFEFLATQSEDLRKGIADLRKVIRDLDETIEKQFNETFRKVGQDFERFFKILFNGGMARLVKVEPQVIPRKVTASDEADENEIEDEEPQKPTAQKLGIDIQATPPGKRLKSISMLSGGERALTSLALISAIISNNPSPFVVLDEVDAALDEANSVRYAEIIEQLSHHTQFIVITHNRATMHHSNILYGVTMDDDGASKVLSLKLEDIEKN